MTSDYSNKNYNNLKKELEDAKHTLSTLNENIRRIIGRKDLKAVRNDKYKTTHETKRCDSERVGQKNSDEAKFKRRNQDVKSVFNRLSAPASRSSDDEARPRINSRVIRELPTRQEIVAAQGTDSESRARNRRMFSSLLGTLHKFCQEESRLKQKEDKKAQIEKKLEEQETLERAVLKRERESLFLDRKRKQFQIKILELKMSRIKDFEVWESSMSMLKHHIRTKSRPHIYYRPKINSTKTEELMLENQQTIDNLVERRRVEITRELAELEENFKNHEVESEVHYDDYVIKENKKDDGIKILNSPCSEIYLQKDDLDSKENQCKNLSESGLSSSIVVVQNL